MNPHLPDLRRKAAALPLCPGVYLMKDESGRIIYVGKSRKLKNRVSSYFLADQKTPKTQKMVSHVTDFDYILCDGEMEALTLENTLIKRHTPHYNIRLKDAKSYPYIKITAEEYPRVVVTRERYPSYQGAVVVCEGAGDAAVRLALTEAVSALTGLSAERISIVQWKS